MTIKKEFMWVHNHGDGFRVTVRTATSLHQIDITRQQYVFGNYHSVVNAEIARREQQLALRRSGHGRAL